MFSLAGDDLNIVGRFQTAHCIHKLINSFLFDSAYHDPTFQTHKIEMKKKNNIVIAHSMFVFGPVEKKNNLTGVILGWSRRSPSPTNSMLITSKQ